MCALRAAARPERHDSAESAHLSFCQLVLPMRRQSGIADLRNVVAPHEKLGDPLGVAAMRLHAKRQRLRSSQRQIRIEWTRHRTDAVLMECDLRSDLGIVAYHRTAERVAMSADILRRRMHDE